MKVAIMQPYIFPYIGYFQLINAVDVFVFYDDVNFIKRGWINRNRLLCNGKSKLISFPCKKASQNKLIKEVEIDVKSKEFIKILEFIRSNYKKAPYFEDVFPILEKIFSRESCTISDFTIDSTVEISEYLEIKTKFMTSAENFYESKGMEKSDRLISITKKLNGNEYINSIGGKELYTKEYFSLKNIDLFFLKPSLKEYKQFSNEFIAGLSIIDVLMFNSKEGVLKMLNEYDLV